MFSWKANVDAETANKLIRNFNPESGVNAQVYARGVLQAYTYGFYGMNKANTMGKNTLSRKLTNEQRSYAYGLGREYGKKKAAQDQAEVKGQKKTTQENGKTTKSIRFSYRNDGTNVFNPDGKTLDQQLDDILSSAESFDGRYLYIGQFTQDFIDMVSPYVEIKDLPVAMNYRDAYLSMENKENGKYKGDGINYHNLGKSGMKAAIEAFNHPEQVLLSKNAEKIELVLESTDYKGNKMLAIVALNTSARNTNKFIEAHIVTSIYGRRSIDKYIDKAETEGRLIYKKIKSQRKAFPKYITRAISTLTLLLLVYPRTNGKSTTNPAEV